MRFLKKKLLKAQEALKNQTLQSQIAQSDTNSAEISVKIYEAPLASREDLKDFEPQTITEEDKNKSKKEDSSMKNIAVNYAQAIASFAKSHLATPYLQNRLQKESLTLKEFVNFVKREKNKLGGISSFRARLLVQGTDTEKLATCKRVFQWIAGVFIKYFSVNWIIHGKVSQKDVYLKFRYKMLRRIQNPEYFTCIKERESKTKVVSPNI